MKRATVILAVLVLFANVVPARAGFLPAGSAGSSLPGDPSYDLTFSIQGNVGHATLDTNPSGLTNDTGFHAVAGTLIVTGGTYAGNYNLFPGGPTVTGTKLVTSFTTYYDNLVYPGNDAGSGANNGALGYPKISNPSYLDYYGLVFQSGGTYISLYVNLSNNYEFDVYANNKFAPFVGGSVNLSPTAAVPEPSSITLIGIGAVGLGIFRLRRRKGAVA